MRLRAIPLLFLFFLQSLMLVSQNTITLTGYINDAETKKPLQYVNIGFVNESVGTVSDSDGKFYLTFNPIKINNNSILKISYIGYKTTNILASEFISSIAKEKNLFLQPETFSLDEVVLSSDLRKEREVGTLNLDWNTIGYWLNPKALGGEIATKIYIESPNTKLHELKFYVTKNNSGHIKIRVNVYEYKNGFPIKNLLSQNIFHTIKTNSGIETINLEPYNIIVNNDVVVSLELIEVFGRYIDFAIGGSDYKTFSYTRLYNQDEWKRYQQGMAIKVRTSYPDPNGKVIAKSRTRPNKIVIYWDSSLAMQDENRSTKKELRLLKNYLKDIRNVTVKIIKFSAFTLDQKIFNVAQGDTDAVIDFLENTQYDGEASFKNVLKSNDFEADVALLFSRAKTILEPLEQTTYIPTFGINSLSEANHNQLQAASFYGDGGYVDLSRVSVKEGLEMMVTKYRGDISYEESPENLGNIKGRVLSDSMLISRASIKVKNTLIETESEKDGTFSIDAEQGDVLVVNALGMIENEVSISNTSYIDVKLQPNTTELNEVILFGKTKIKNITTLTSNEGENAKAIGYGVDEIKPSDINPGDINLEDVISKIPGVLITGVGANKRYSFLRTVKSTTGTTIDPNPIIVIDNRIYYQKDGLNHLPPIDVQSIKSVRAIKSMAGTNRYGSAGAFGAIEISTKNTTINKQANFTKKEDSVSVMGNDYIDAAIPHYEDAVNIPNFIKELEKASTFEDAKSIYQNQKEKQPITIPYILGVSDSFEKWNKDYSFLILTNIAVLADKNSKALKTLAFKLEEVGHLDTAKLVYERIAELRPYDAQSHRDLANIYQETGDYDKALQLYKQILSNSIEGVDFTSLEQLIISELRHLITLHKSKLDLTGLPREFLTGGFKQDLRIIFEWNDPTAEFDLQFVNPNKKFYSWTHSLFENRDRIIDEIEQGYTTEAYLIDDAEAGEWIINFEALNKVSSINPQFLKYTIYRNYGLPNETKHIKVISLQNINQKVRLDSFMYK